MSDPSIETPSPIDPAPDRDPMRDYYQLRNTLLITTLAISGGLFLAVWAFYSLNTALNYLLGALVGLVYLNLLAGEVEKLGAGKRQVSKKGLALFAGLIILASRWQELHIVPVFLGFLTYKAAIIVYTLQSVFAPPGKTNE
ncbi:ATP synthase subunit I [Pannus brasiliensis CCIBt3594]|uniref:ATP synthase subunit I n=2 Tax=Pannus TaxID=1427526 RepID=A0AAW9QYK6_9CHRO